MGSANWVITLGRFDICFAVSSLSRYLIAPRQGHLNAMIKVFGYLKHTINGKIVIDIADPPIRDEATFEEIASWSEFYEDTEEDIPYDMPQSSGCMVKLTAIVDADHARDKVTRRSVSGILILVNNTPINWISKRQKTVELSTYGSELVTARMGVEELLALRYKLRMMGVMIESTSVMIGDNRATILNTTLPSSNLKKKHLACSYHRIREAIAGNILSYGHVPTDKNVADMLSKPLEGPLLYSHLQAYILRKSKASSFEEDDNQKK